MFGEGVFNPCLHHHESFFGMTEEGQEGSVICAVRDCAMRALGENYLCAHTEIGPNLHDFAALDRLTQRVMDIGDSELSDNLYYAQELIIFLDGLVRRSYIGGEHRAPFIPFPNTNEWKGINKCLGEMEAMLSRSHTRGKTILNKGDRKRFNFVVEKIQLYEQVIIESILERVNKLEAIKSKKLSN